MHALIAADSFKDSLSAPSVCAAIASGLRRRSSEVHCIELPLADGGEGTLAVLTTQLRLQTVEVDSFDPLGRPKRASVGLGSDGTAVIEAASVCGLGLLTAAERNPLLTSTAGLGPLIDASRNAKRVVLAIGGTATNDGGLGLAQSLGWRCFDNRGASLVASGAALTQLTRLAPPTNPWSGIPVDVLCDVTNPLFGPNGAAKIYARQKGATDSDIDLLDAGLENLAHVTAECVRKIDPTTPGAGAAGGLGFGAMVFLGARLVPGIETILDWIDFDSALERADVVLTGEGRLDSQTFQGKLISGIARRAARRGIPVIALCGQVAATAHELRALGVTAYLIDESSDPLPTKLAATARRLAATAAKIPLG